MDKVWRLYGLVRVPGDAGDKMLELQFRHLKKNIPWLYLVLIFNILSCVYAVTDSSSVMLRVVLPIMVTSAAIGRTLWWLYHRNEEFDPEKALKFIRRMVIASAAIGSLCAVWSVLAWQSETGTFRYYIPAFMALGAFSTAYCLSLVPRSAILNVTIGVLPICTLLIMSGVVIDSALAVTMLACTLFLIGLVRRQHRNMARMIELQFEMHKMAHTDALTGLQNRRAFHEQLENALAQRGPDHSLTDPSLTNHSLTLAMIDLDGFKQINDNHGHQAGDELLQIAAKRLTDAVGEFGSVSRLGGDEFAVLFEGTLPTLCGQLVQAAIQRLEQPATVDGEQLSVGASYGLTSISGEENMQQVALISQTDMRLYAMKQQRYDGLIQSSEQPVSRSNGRAA